MTDQLEEIRAMLKQEPGSAFLQDTDVEWLLREVVTLRAQCEQVEQERDKAVSENETAWNALHVRDQALLKVQDERDTLQRDLDALRQQIVELATSLDGWRWLGLTPAHVAPELRTLLQKGHDR